MGGTSPLTIRSLWDALSDYQEEPGWIVIPVDFPEIEDTATRKATHSFFKQIERRCHFLI
jgi:hypothetical protein